MIISKRLRIFAWPNGSGKSTLINIVKSHGIDMGIYVNADEIKVDLDNNKVLDFNKYGILTTQSELNDSIIKTTFFDKELKNVVLENTHIESNKLHYKINHIYDYLSAFLADFIRVKLLQASVKFTFETVMSHPSKIDFIKTARNSGYKTYLYFVSLEYPELNKERVKARVKLKGHSVPEEKIESRYYKTMDLLYDMLKVVDKAFFFDNSGSKSVYFARLENSEIIFENPDQIPEWFHKYVLSKI